MKKILPTLCLFVLLLAALPGQAQKYKTVNDTTRLSKEEGKLLQAIADVSNKLTKAQNELPAYQAKAKEAENDASDAASASADQASKANSGKVKDAKRAKRKASKAYGEAKDSRSATNNLNDLEKKISRYQEDLTKKQQRLQELVTMRAAINATIVPGATPVMQ